VSPLSLASSLLMRQDCVRGNIFLGLKGLSTKGVPGDV